MGDETKTQTTKQELTMEEMKEKIRKHLEAEEQIGVSSWLFTPNADGVVTQECNSDCCNDEMEIKAAVNTIIHLSDGDFEDIHFY